MATIDAFLEYHKDPKAFAAKMEEFSAAETKATAAIAHAEAETEKATALVRQLQSDQDAFAARVIAFERSEQASLAAISEARSKIDAGTIKLNDRAQGLARDEAALQARTVAVQAREAEAARLISEGAQSAERAKRLASVFSDAVNGIASIANDAKAKAGSA